MEQLKTTPHFWNLNEYPNLTGKVIHFTPQGKTRLGSKKANPPPEVTLAGLSIQPEHALVENDGNKKVTLLPLTGAKVVLNGNEIMEKKELHHNDRVMFGITNLFVFHHPQDFAKQQIDNKTVATPSYDSAQQEITQKFDLSKFMSGGKSEDDLLKKVLLEVLPMINEANAISEELEKNCKFEVALIPPRLEGRKTEMCVKMCNLGNDTEFIWDRSKFINRKFLIQKMYQSYMDGDEYWDLPKDKDPFWEDPNTEVCLGSIVVYLQSLAYMMEIEENMQVMDYRGMEQGHLQVVIMPCKKDGTELTDDYVDDPEELVGKDLHFKVKILNAQGLPGKFVSTCCKYKMYLDGQPTTTKEVAGMNPEYGYEKQYVFHPVTNQFVDYLQNDALIIEVWGRQKAGSGTSLSTKSLRSKFRSTRTYSEQPIELPKHWKLVKSLEEDTVQKAPVDTDVTEAIKRLVQLTWDHDHVGHGRDAKNLKHKTIEVTKVEQIESTHLYKEYERQRKTFSERAAKKPFPKVTRDPGEEDIVTSVHRIGQLDSQLIPEINEHFLFHGAKMEFIDAILKQGIDYRLGNAGLFGKGAYFCEMSTKADQYTDSKGDRASGEHVMILAKVILGHSYFAKKPDSTMTRPPCVHYCTCKCEHMKSEFHDSVMGTHRNLKTRLLFREFIIFEATQSYPAYLITYVRK